MRSVAQRLLLRKIDRTAITVMMLVPIIALLIGSNLLVTGYLHETQASLVPSNPNHEYIVYNSSDMFPNSMSYGTYLQINASGVRQAIPYLQVNGEMFVDKTNYSVSVVATEIQSFVHLKHPSVFGNLPTKKDEIAVGAILAKLLNVKIGDQINVTMLSQTNYFSITSILNSTSKYDAMLLLPLSTMWNDWPSTAQSVSFVEFQSSGVPTNIPVGLTVTSETSLNQVVSSFAEETSDLIQVWIYILLGVSATVAVAASYRTIGGAAFEYRILRTIGARISTARKMLVWEHFMVSGISVLVGVAAGLAVTQAFSTFLNSTFATSVITGIDLQHLALLGVSAFALIFLSGVVTIYRLPESIQSGVLTN